MIPIYNRGDVLMDDHRLYVVLSSSATKVGSDEAIYRVLVLAVFKESDTFRGEYAGMHYWWGSGVELDTHLGKTALPATL